jgi:hypothetical protein
LLVLNLTEGGVIFCGMELCHLAQNLRAGVADVLMIQNIQHQVLALVAVSAGIQESELCLFRVQPIQSKSESNPPPVANWQ